MAFRSFLFKRKLSYFKNHGCFIISYPKKIKKQILILIIYYKKSFLIS